MRKTFLSLVATGLVSGGMAAQAQELEAFGPCGPVYPFRLEGDVCHKVRPGVKGSRSMIGDGVVHPVFSGRPVSCCVTKQFAIVQGQLRPDTRAEACGDQFKLLRDGANQRNSATVRQQMRVLARSCPDEFREVVETAARNAGSSTSSGSMGSQLYGSLNQRSSSDLENLAAQLRRDPSGDLSVADIMMVGLQIGIAASSLYPGRSIRFSNPGVTPGSRGIPRIAVPNGARPSRQSDITGTGR